MLNKLTRFGIPIMLVIGAIAVLVALFSASSQSSSANGLKRFAKGELEDLEFINGQVRPSSQFENAYGKMITLAEYGDKTIVLNIWFEACPPCQEEMPSLAELQKQTADEGVKVVAIAVDREHNREGNRKALAEWSDGVLDFHFDYSFGIAIDTASRGMPTTIIYDRHGEEMARLSGSADWASPEALALVRDVAVR